jgi:hypothetical protein
VGDESSPYRPLKLPANGHIQDDAGDAVGILWLYWEKTALPTDLWTLQPGAHKIVLNVAVAEEWVLDAKNLKVGRPTAGTDNSPDGCRRTPFRGMMG